MEVTSTNGTEQRTVESSTSELLRRMLTEKKALEPSIGEDGRVHYPFAEGVLRAEGVPNPEPDIRAWISDMVALGILRVSSTMEIVMCPTHLRADPMIQLECANCKARSTRKTALVEHIYCGFIGDDARFKKDGVLKCPNCQRSIATAQEVRVSGVWYECPSCFSKASSPRLVFVCRVENHDFTAADIVMMPVHTYSVVESMTSDLKNRLVLDPSLADLLETLGYEVSHPASVKGRSGALHAFDLYGMKDGQDIALQVAVDSKPVDAAAVLSFFVKAYDMRAKLAILVAIPSASEAAKKINAGYGVILVEDADGSGVVDKVKALLQKENPG